MDHHHYNARIKGRDGNGYENDDGESVRSGVDTSQLMYGSISIALIIILCLIGTCLKSRRRRMVAREQENQAISRRLNEEAMLTLRKGRAEKNVLSLKFIKKRNCAEGYEEIDDSARSKLFSKRSNRMRLPTPEVLGTDCAICFLPFEESEHISFSHNFDCNHFFHRKCIVDWLARDDRCPSCRRNYLSGKEDEQEISIVNVTTYHSDVDEEDQVVVQSSINEEMNQLDANGASVNRSFILDNSVDLNIDHVQSEEISLQPTASNSSTVENRTIRVSFPIESIS